MASCGAVVACAVVSLGIAVDAVLMGKIVEGALEFGELGGVACAEGGQHPCPRACGDAEWLVLGQRQLVDQFEKPGWRLLS
jgi:hypothetical protein